MTSRTDHNEEETLASGPSRSSSPRTRFTLVVSAGTSAGARFEVDAASPNRCYAGKSETCEFRIEDPRASRRHFAFEVRQGCLRIEDLDSTNGTWINGVRIREAMLLGGETIQVGGSTIAVETSEPGEPEKLAVRAGFGRVIGSSPAMLRLYPLCARLASSNVPVIIEGETGTGKELMAESLHEQGPRASKPFVVFDCTTVAPNLVESNLFGHEKGAFTGADRERKGVFEQADKGTLFIDEIGDLDIALQAKLLRAIQRSEVQRVGGTGWIKVDVRIICATRRDLELEIQQKRFREDLFYRLAVARIELPPLRNREGDVVWLARYFWGQLGGKDAEIPPGFLARLERQPWPGNIRELHNAVAQTVALGDLQHMVRARPSTPPPAAQEPCSDERAAETILQILEEDLPYARARERMQIEFQRLYVERALDKHGGNVPKAAAASGISRRYFDMMRTRGVPRS